MTVSKLSPLIALLALGACATSSPTLYAPAFDGGNGYSHQQIESDRFRVRFDAGRDMDIGEAEDMALLRAAHITLDEGADWFIVVSRGRDGNDRNPVRVGGSASRSIGSHGYSGSSVGIGIRINPSAGEKSATLEILIREGVPEDGPEAYDARDVIDNTTPPGHY